MTLAQFMADIHDDGPLTEWVAGEVVVHLPPTTRHQDIAAFVFMLLRHFVDFFGLGRALMAPVGLLVTPSGPLRQPDVVVLTRDHADRLRPGYVECPADLVVEIVSPDSPHRDRVEKLGEYALGGVREYWVIDPRPTRPHMTFHVLDDAGHYGEVHPDANGVYRSAVLPGFWLEASWLDAAPLPDAFQTFAQIAGLPDAAVEAMRQAQRRGPQR